MLATRDTLSDRSIRSIFCLCFCTEQEITTLGLNKVEHVKSVNFPMECCEARQYLIQFEDEASSEGYLRMIFDDLDLPKGTILQVVLRSLELC